MRGLKTLAVIAASIVLAGCASAPAAIETVEPSAATSAAAASQPTSRLGLTCDDLLSPVLVANVLNTTTVTTDLMVRPASASPLGYSVSQFGGSSCLARGEEAAQSWVSVQVLPEATAQWATYAEKNTDVVTGASSSFGDASNVSCFAFGADSTCSVNVLVGDNWIEVIARGIAVEPSLSNEAVAEFAAPLITDIVSTVTNAAASGPVGAAPALTGVLPSDCAVYATVDEYRAAFGTAEEVLIGRQSDGEVWGIDNAAATIVAVDGCTWVPASTGQTWPLYITALPGGEWAFDRSSALMTADDSAQTVSDSVAGVDRATFGCQVYSGFCTLDTVIAGNWVQFSAERDLIGTEDEVRALLIEIAERAVARFPA
ncbi:hypothetical protein [Cryobacterium lyxosi]|uniref:DUF3558 domain-containing protein n=1 Tax=Cryobacterium lyxosi TaxID=1259228 RepID=A0A4R8ZJ33_9MICO|nr:hypothetical protein [Cryobacterium lyxosi]TFD29183.1 hypothetical protein E3T27_00160 [Cryobacterium lyxosi]